MNIRGQHSNFKNNLFVTLSYKEWNHISFEERNYLRKIHGVHTPSDYKNFLRRFKPLKFGKRYKIIRKNTL